MTPEDYGRAGDLFEQLRELPEGERASALDSACAGNAQLREQVWNLLEADRAAGAGSFLERRAIEDAARLLASNPQMGNPRLGPLLPGTRFGPYEITAPIAAGGMGEVYRARDSKLGRDVAIKVLPAALAGDAQYMARFEREAQVLASLNHPNIATVYGVEQGALVMELVEGANLRGPLPLEEAIPIARQIAVGLEAAHERGVTHRDLKPANIRITPAGVVKLLDFGLAKTTTELPPAISGEQPSPSPAAMTLAGMILGTAAYMSPEQARGKPVDKRTDIWAFGVVLFEMLTGRPLFGGETITDTLASVVKDTPQLDALPADTPPRIRRLLNRCLRKDVQSRLRDIGEARVLLDEPDEVLAAPRRVRMPWLAAGVAAIAALVIAALWLLHPAKEERTFRLSVLPPLPNASFSAISLPALSPDGRNLAFAAGSEGKPQLWIRDLMALTARPLPGTEGAFDPFWSPDSRSVGFFVPGKLKAIAIAGGPAVTLCDAPDGRGGSWNRADVILFTPSFGAPLSRVAAAGGAATPVTTLNETAGETSHRFPWFLPDGRHFLFTVRSGNPEKTAVYAGDLQSKERRFLIAAASNAVYSPPGFLLFMRERTVMALAFDAASLRTTGDPFPAAEQVDYVQGNIQGQFSVSQNGVLAYNSGGGSLRSQLTWFDRGGKPLGTVGPPAIMQAAALSPDGATVAVDRLDAPLGTYDLWLHELAHGNDSRFTFDPSNDMFPVWSPDGGRILFSSNRTGKYGLYQKAATGAGKEDLVYRMEGVTLPTGWSRDFVIFSNTALKTGDDIWVLPLAGDRKAFPFLQTEFSESDGKLSPDERWLAYDSNETGTQEVYVQTFPGKESKWQISAAGGTRPVWSRDGKELFYIAADNKMMATDVKSGAEFEHGVARELFEVRMPPRGLFDVSRDGKRFLILGPVEPEASAPMTLVINWNAGLKK
jgi:serine/threonine protein kinase/Tol biopolymer transport system component